LPHAPPGVAAGIREARREFEAVTGHIAVQLGLPEGQLDAGAITGGLDRAHKLMLGMAALAAAIVDLATTGGLITLAVRQRACGACTCGRLA
jgi:hypothetical protein